MKQNVSSRPAATLAVRIGIVLSGLAVAAICGFYFSPWLASWLALLGLAASRSPWLGVSALFATVSVDTVQPVWGGIYVSFSELAFAVAVLGWLFSALPDCASWDWRALKWGLPFSAAVLLSALANNQAHEVIPHLLRASELTVAIFLASNAFRQKDLQDRFRWALAAAAAVYSINGLLQFPTVRGWRIYSLFDNPNQFAGYLNLLLPVVLVQFFVTAGQKVRYVWAALLALLALAAAAAQSRAAMLAGLISAGLLWLIHYQAALKNLRRQPLSSVRSFLRRSALPLAVAAVIATTATLWVGRSHPSELASAWKLLSERGPYSQRIPFLQLGLQVWKDHFLLGVGPGNYPESLDSYPELLDRLSRRFPPHSEFRGVVRLHVHNLYLQLGIDYGLLGLTAFLYLMTRLLREFQVRCRDSSWHCAGIGVLAAFLMHNMFDVTFPSLALEAGLLIGVLLSNGGAGQDP